MDINEVNEKIRQVRKAAKDLSHAYELAELNPENLSEKEINFADSMFKLIISGLDRENSPLNKYKSAFKEIADQIENDKKNIEWTNYVPR